MEFPQPERREIRNSQGAVRTYVRYPGQRSWYRSLATAQIEYQREYRRRDALLTKALGIEPGETIRIEIEGL